MPVCMSRYIYGISFDLKYKKGHVSVQEKDKENFLKMNNLLHMSESLMIDISKTNTVI